MKIIKISGYVSLQVLSVFLPPMLFTFFSEWLSSTGFFGDTECVVYCLGLINDGLDWGIRHYLYFWVCISLFLCNAARAFLMSTEYLGKAWGNK